MQSTDIAILPGIHFNGIGLGLMTLVTLGDKGVDISFPLPALYLAFTIEMK